jgi:diacylglycerol kinase family enzyme
MGGWLAIANPRAGAFRQRHFREKWLPEVTRRVARVVYTEAPGQAREIARSAQDFAGIVVIGGDGTIFEVLEGMQRKDQRLALIPAGRGNCLALDLCVGKLSVALDAIANGHPVGIDLLELQLGFEDGRCHTCLAASTLAIGYVANVVQLAQRLGPLGRHAYTVAAVLSRPRQLFVEADYEAGATEASEVTGIVINNTRHLANFRAFPQASPSDGLVDVLELKAGRARQLLHNISVLSQGYFYNPGRELQCRRAHLKLQVPDVLMVDGELFEDVIEMQVTCRPSAVLVQQGNIQKC